MSAIEDADTVIGYAPYIDAIRDRLDAACSCDIAERREGGRRRGGAPGRRRG